MICLGEEADEVMKLVSDSFVFNLNTDTGFPPQTSNCLTTDFKMHQILNNSIFLIKYAVSTNNNWVS